MKKQRIVDFTKRKIAKYFILMMAFILLFFSGTMYFLVSKQVDKKLKSENYELTKMLETNFNYLEKEINRIEKENSHDPKEIQKQLYKMRSESNLKFNFILLEENKIIATNLYDKNIESFYKNPLLSETVQYIDKYDDIVITDHSHNYHDIYSYTKEQKAEMLIAKEFKEGYLFIEILEGSFDKLNNQLNSTLVISDEFNNIIYENGKKYEDDIGKLKMNVENQINYSIPINFFDREITILNFKDTYFNKQIIMLGYIIIFIIFVMIAMTTPFLSKKISKIINEPLIYLVDVVEKNKKGKLNHAAELTSLYEFNLLIKEYNSLLESVQELIKSNKELANREKWMEIKVLQEQFNPHFIYNTLESIRYEIYLNPENASDMILSLSQIMRYSIKNYMGTVFLHEDIKYIKDYLALQKMRFDERLDYEIQLSDRMLSTKIPRLLIQPLVENSIKYNMESVDDLKLVIEDEVLDTTINLIVKDNGIGMDQQALNKLKDNLNNKKYADKNYGIYNVHRTVQLLYGEEFGIKKLSNQNGMTIEISFPKEDVDV